MEYATYRQYDALGLAKLVRTGDVLPRELLETAMARIAAVNPRINAVVVERYERARGEIDAGLPDGPFRGVPFLLKDLYAALPGEPLTNGSRFWRGATPAFESELVRRYRAAGLVIAGRGASPELGNTATTESRAWGQTRNPWDLSRSSGGSSGGSAAAVAAGVVPAAHATDGGGSIRIPASCCGLFGLKPTRARTPSGPDAGERWAGMSSSHVVSRTVRDSAALLDATAGPDIGAPYYAERPAGPYLAEVGKPPGRLRIGLQLTSWSGAEPLPQCADAVREAALLCQSLGHEVEEVRVPVDGATLGRAMRTIVSANTAVAVARREAELGRPAAEEELEHITRKTVRDGAAVPATAYIEAVRTVHALGRMVGRFFEQGRYDLLLTPTLATPPLELGRLSLDREDAARYNADLGLMVAFTSLFNATGSPAMSVPLHWNESGLPIGVQFVGRYGEDAGLFRLAAQLEEARPWAWREPPL